MSMVTRACVATYGLAALLTGLSVRLYDLAVHKHAHYRAIAFDTYVRKEEIPARRGNISDVHHAVLARVEPFKKVIANHTLLFQRDKKTGKIRRDYRDKAAEILGRHLHLTPEEVLARIPNRSQYAIVAPRISEQTASEIQRELDAGKVHGIHLEQDYERIYPAGNLLGHVLGYYACTKENPVRRGMEGIERSMDTWLTGQNGWRYFEKDGLGEEIPSYRGEERAPRNGANVRLTIDFGVQQIVESELEAAYKALLPKKATVIVMEPQTGAILAMANRPDFNPNFPGEEGRNRLNHAVASIYEPGSTFKTLSAAGALNRGKATINEVIWCRNGIWNFPGGPMKDHHPYGNLTVAEVIAKSSNIGAVTLAKRLGEEPFYELIRSFGFGMRTGISLPGEVPGILHPLRNWSAVSMYYVPFGHEVAATPLQVITATCVFANGGNLMMPQIIRDVTDDGGQVLLDYPPQVIRAGLVKEETCRDITAALEKVTAKGGTGTRARVPGFRVAGKTGTTQLFDHKLKRYSREDHVVSFVGYLPADNPRFCCLVVIEDSSVVNGREDAGGLLAAPVFAKIAERTARQLGLQPDPVLLAEDRKATPKEGR